MKNLMISAIREDNILSASALSLVKGGAINVSSCTTDICKEDSGTCGENKCTKNTGSCNINHCTRNGDECTNNGCTDKAKPFVCGFDS